LRFVTLARLDARRVGGDGSTRSGREASAPASVRASHAAHDSRRARGEMQWTAGARHESCAGDCCARPDAGAKEALMQHRAPVPAHTAQLLSQRAFDMRSALTLSEARLWSRLRARQLGVQFRRQVVVGRFVVDFLAPAAGLAVEVDGGYHASRRRADEQRDRKLRRLGYRLLRLPSTLVMRDLDTAVDRVRAALREPP
jgi:very-short-patch-repair endonuclease